ncbi:RNA polymerase sigma factor [Glacieibacterium sp.]|uniref:RNA polymerase sigma factor n=1 Tax=Glacieibacterium sp. TaxID=2860237 RepID=UPI003B00ADB7
MIAPIPWDLAPVGEAEIVQTDASPAGGGVSQRFRPALMAFFLRRIRNHSEAEDLTQEVLLRATQRSETIDPLRPDGYIFQIAANLLRDRARRYHVRAAYQAGLGVTEAGRVEERDPDRVLRGKQSLATVIAALMELPERTRTIFVLFRLENLKQREIADMLGVSVRTVEQHVVRASVHLREKFGVDA